MNPYYRYPSIHLWESASWAHKKAPTDPLMDWLVPTVYRQRYQAAGGPSRFAGRTDGQYNAKSNMYILPDLVEKWERKGLHFHCTSMGFVAWMAMLPRDVMARTAVNPKVIVIPHCADFSDPYWAMTMLDTMDRYNELAARENCALLYLVFGGERASGIYMDIMLELAAIFRIDMKHTYLDLTALHEAGTSLGDIPGFEPARFPAEESIGGLPVLDITGKWQAGVGHQFIVDSLNRRTPGYDSRRHRHSTVGRRMADSMFMEHQYASSDDPELIAHWEEMGLVYESHHSLGERWVTLAPKCAPEQPEKKLPVLLVMKEVRDIAPAMTLTAFQFYYDFIEIASQGECILLFFAMETPDDNDMLADLLREAQGLYPIDPERVYVIGQSHNGMFALEFARRHPDLVAAVAQLNDRHYINAPRYSVDNVLMTDEMIDDMAAHDMPLINICGHVENVFAHVDVDSEEFAHAAEGYQRRLRAFRCPAKPLEDIKNAHLSADLATRKNGIPADRTEVRYSMGSELYISHLQNQEGKWHLDLVSVENLPHMITPQMAELAWSFLRRFARDPETGEIKELY